MYDKSKRLLSLMLALDGLPSRSPPTSLPGIDPQSEFYPFSNERGVQSVIEALRTRPISYCHPSTIRVGVLIGESNMFSMLPELRKQCDVIVIADINSYLLAEMRTVLQLLNDAKDPQDFERLYQSRSRQLSDEAPSQTIQNLQMRRLELGGYHFLYSHNRFFTCQRAAHELTFAFVQTIFFDLTNRDAFFKVFSEHQASISFFNFTNLHEWDSPVSLSRTSQYSDWQPQGNIAQLVHCLSQHQPIVTGSFRENIQEACALRLSLFNRPLDYLRVSEVNTRAYLSQKFPNYPCPVSLNPAVLDEGYGGYMPSYSDRHRRLPSIIRRRTAVTPLPRAEETYEQRKTTLFGRALTPFPS